MNKENPVGSDPYGFSNMSDEQLHRLIGSLENYTSSYNPENGGPTSPVPQDVWEGRQDQEIKLSLARQELQRRQAEGTAQ